MGTVKKQNKKKIHIRRHLPVPPIQVILIPWKSIYQEFMGPRLLHGLKRKTTLVFIWYLTINFECYIFDPAVSFQSCYHYEVITPKTDPQHFALFQNKCMVKEPLDTVLLTHFNISCNLQWNPHQTFNWGTSYLGLQIKKSNMQILFHIIKKINLLYTYSTASTIHLYMLNDIWTWVQNLHITI